MFVIAARCEVVADSLRRKWRKKLLIPDRSAADLAEYGYQMRVVLEAAQLQRQHVRRRIIVLDMGGAPNVPDS